MKHRQAWSTVLLMGLAGCERESSQLDAPHPAATAAAPAVVVVETPFDLAPIVESPIPLSTDDRQAVQRLLERLAEPKGWHPSRALHVVRALRHWASTDDDLHDRARAIVAAFLNETEARQQFGRAVAIPTRWGMRYPTRPANSGQSGDIGQESHRDQTLATLAELRLAPRTEIVCADSTYSLVDVLHDSVAGFYLNQQELAWTAAVYASLVQSRRWVNRYGESFDFDAVVQELIRRGSRDGSCGGTHSLHALALLVRRDIESPVLSADVRVALHRELAQFAQKIEQSQRPDGSWGKNWNNDLGSLVELDGDDQRLVVTSHLAEWILWLPVDLRPARSCLKKSSEWLIGVIRDDTKWNINEDFCPLSHAACVVLVLSGDGQPNLDLSTSKYKTSSSRSQ